MSAWDQFESTGNYVEFANVGDSVAGVLLHVGAKTWPAENDKPARITPQLQIRRDGDGEEVTLTAGWVLLISELKKAAPDVGDWLKITNTAIAPKPKETRSWAVEVKKAGTFAAPAVTQAPPNPTPAPVQASPAASVPATAATPPASADPLASLTAEQRAALGLPPLVAADPLDSDPRVPALRAMGLADDAIRNALGL